MAENVEEVPSSTTTETNTNANMAVNVDEVSSASTTAKNAEGKRAQNVDEVSGSSTTKEYTETKQAENADEVPNASKSDKNTDTKMEENVENKTSENIKEVKAKPLKSLQIFKTPLCLITTDEDGALEIVDDTLKELEDIELGMNVIAVAGLYRTGKSYLMNRLAGSSSGFALGGSIQSKTKGIWAWCKKHPTQDGQVLLLLDTEGLGDVQKGSINHDNKIFTIATLLSSTLVYNMMTAFNQDAVEKLTFITMMSDNLKLTSTSSSDDDFDFIMPRFVLALRDFSLDLEIDGEEITEDQYLEECLKSRKVKTEEDKKYNQPRECIRKYFTQRKVFTFDRPGERSVMKKLDKADNRFLSKDFVSETKKFVSYVYGCEPKILHNKSMVTGSMMAKLLRVYIKAMKDGKVPCVEDAMMTMAHMENKKQAEEAMREYDSMMENIKLPVYDRMKLLEKYYEIQKDVMERLNARLMLKKDHSVEKELEKTMKAKYEELDGRNTQNLSSICLTKIQEMHKITVAQNIEKGKYEVPGGHVIYKDDMHDLVDEYNNELKDIDPAVRQKAQTEFQHEKLKENENIMTRDKTLSNQEKEESMKRQMQLIQEELKKTQENEKTILKLEFEKKEKLYEAEMENIRQRNLEAERANIAKYNEDVLSRRDAQFEEIVLKLARLETELAQTRQNEQEVKRREQIMEREMALADEARKQEERELLEQMKRKEERKLRELEREREEAENMRIANIQRMRNEDAGGSSCILS